MCCPQIVTDKFDVLFGVLQDDILALYLFIIVQGYAKRKALQKGGNLHN